MKRISSIAGAVTMQRIRRWCEECAKFTPSGVDRHAREYCLTCHPEPGYDTWEYDEEDDDEA